MHSGKLTSSVVKAVCLFILALATTVLAKSVKCDRCGRWVNDSSMSYFNGYKYIPNVRYHGRVCQICYEQLMKMVRENEARKTPQQKAAEKKLANDVLDWGLQILNEQKKGRASEARLKAYVTENKNKIIKFMMNDIRNCMKKNDESRVRYRQYGSGLAGVSKMESIIKANSDLIWSVEWITKNDLDTLIAISKKHSGFFSYSDWRDEEIKFFKKCISIGFKITPDYIGGRDLAYLFQVKPFAILNKYQDTELKIEICDIKTITWFCYEIVFLIKDKKGADLGKVTAKHNTDANRITYEWENLALINLIDYAKQRGHRLQKDETTITINGKSMSFTDYIRNPVDDLNAKLIKAREEEKKKAEERKRLENTISL